MITHDGRSNQYHSGTNYVNGRAPSGFYQGGTTPGSLDIEIPLGCTYIPELRLENVTSLRYPDDLAFGNLEIEGCTNDLSLPNLEARRLKWNTRGGALNIDGLLSDDAEIGTGRGNVVVDRWKGGKASFGTVGGKVTLGSVIVDELKGKTGNGGIDISALSTTGATDLVTVGGSVDIGAANVKSIATSTGNGNPEIAKLRAREGAYLKTVGGQLTLPNSRVNNLVTDSGNGNVSLGDLYAEADIVIDTCGGRVAAGSIAACGFKASTGNGEVVIDDLLADTATVATIGGDVTFKILTSKNTLMSLPAMAM